MSRSDSTERFIAAAVRPLADNAEMQAMTEQELRHMIATNPATEESDASFEEAAIAMENASSRFPWKKWLYLLTAVVSVIAAIPAGKDYLRLRLASWGLFAMTDSFSLALPGLPFRGNASEKVQELIGDFSPEEELLLFGRFTGDGQGRWKALWDSSPENPAYFSQYFLTTVDRHNPPPPDPKELLEIADRLAPGNAWFRQIAAAVLAQNSVREDGFKSLGRGSKVPVYTITDPAKVAEAIRLIKEAAAMTNYRNYQDEILLERLKILPRGDNILDRKIVDAYLEMDPPRSWPYHHRLNQLLAAASRDFATRGSTQEFVDFLQAWEILRLKALGNPEPSPWPGILRPTDMAAKAVASAASDLGQQELAARYEKLAAELRVRREKERADSEKRDSSKRAGFLATRLALHSTRGVNPPLLTDEDLKPGRMASQAMLARIHSIFGWFFFAFAAVLTAVARFRHGKQARMLSKSLENVLRPIDYTWILGVGVTLPFLLHQSVEHFTPFGGTSFSPFKTMEAEFARNAAIAGLMLTLGALMVSWRVARRMSCVGWNYRSAMAVIALLAGISVWIAACILGYTGGAVNSDLIRAMRWFLGTLAVGGAIRIPISVVFSRRERAVQSLVASRAMIPVCVFAMLLMALASPTNHAVEKYWTKREPLTEIDPTVPARTRYEYEMQQATNAEALELLRRSP